MNITSSSDLTLDEMTEASDRIYQEVGDDAEIIWGQTFDEDLGDEMRITVIATGIDSGEPEESNNIHRFDPATQLPEHQQHKIVSRAVKQTTEPIARGHVRTPTPEEAFAWGSESMIKTFFSRIAKEAARFMAVVVFPTPPFWLATVIIFPIIESIKEG